MLRTADGRLGQTIRNDVYTALPLVMNTGGPRDPTAFMFLMPGVQSVGRWGNVMGGQDFTNDTYVEGVPITNAVVQGEGRNLSLGISVEAIDQFQVETSGTAVMYNGQGASNYVVKSGTNLFRGSAFEFFRNKGLDSKAFFAATKPDDNQHEFGFTLGGPLRRNQAFFFVAYDGYRDRRQTESRLISIPTAAQRNGDFSALPVVIYDPATTRPNPNGTGFVRDPFPGNIIPPAASRRSRATCSRTCPTRPTAACRTTISAASLPIGFNNDNVTAKVDLQADRRGTRSRCCSRTASAARRRRIAAAPTPRPRCRCPTPRRGSSRRCRPRAQVKHTYVIGSRWVNQASLGFARLSVPIFNATIDGALPDRGRDHGPAARRGGLRRSLRSSSPARTRRRNWRGTDARAFTEYLNNYTFQDNLQWTAGRHAVTFGFQAQRMDAERARANLRQPRHVRVQQLPDCRLHRPRGRSTPATGNAYASFLLGELNATNVIEDSEVATSGRFYHYAFWVQDDFKVTPEPDAQPRAALRHHEAVHRGLRSLVVHEPRSAEPRRRRVPRRRAVRRRRPEQLQMPNADQDLLWRHRAAARRRLQPERRHGAARLLRHQLFAARRRRRPCRRAQRHRHARVFGQRVVPEPERVRRRPTTGTTACRRIRRRRSSIRRSTRGSSPDAERAAA